MFPIEAFQSTLRKFTSILNSHGIRFHLTGGITSVAYGEPRMTQDIDIVIDNDAAVLHCESLISSLTNSDFLFDATVLRAAIEGRDMFQLLDTTESLKLDVYPRELIPGELDRSDLIEIFEGEQMPIVSRADAAASKLVWVSKGSHKSRRDLRHIYRNAEASDQDLVRRLATDLGLGRLLDEVLDESDEIAD